MDTLVSTPEPEPGRVFALIEHGTNTHAAGSYVWHQTVDLTPTAPWWTLTTWTA